MTKEEIKDLRDENLLKTLLFKANVVSKAGMPGQACDVEQAVNDKVLLEGEVLNRIRHRLVLLKQNEEQRKEISELEKHIRSCDPGYACSDCKDYGKFWCNLVDYSMDYNMGTEEKRS